MAEATFSPVACELILEISNGVAPVAQDRSVWPASSCYSKRIIAVIEKPSFFDVLYEFMQGLLALQRLGMKLPYRRAKPVVRI